MDEKKLCEFIDRICDITGMECYDDGGEPDDDVEEADLLFCGQGEVGIQISSDFERFSIYVPFSFADYRKDEIENLMLDVDEVEMEKRTALTKNLFYLWCKCRECVYPITEWDDGNYMCPGYVAWVGYYDIPYSDEVVEHFVGLANQYEEVYGQYSSRELREEIFLLLCKDREIYVDKGKHFILGKDTKVSFSERRINFENNVVDIYRGKKYVIIKNEDEKYALDACMVNLFYETFELCEMFADVRIYCDGNRANMFSDHIMFSMPIIKDVGYFSREEETYLMMDLKRFFPFATSGYQETFCECLSNFFKKGYIESNGIVITEGITDSMHLKKYWEYLKKDYTDYNISFWDYGMEGENNYKSEMGGSELLKMCKEFAKIRQSKKMIFIADCDDYRVAREMQGDKEYCYKSWGNNVYSFTLPVPLHRKGQNDICIEHLYTDEEIKQEFICGDGIKRRLYMGNEFDNYGRSINSGFLCTKSSFCGENSNKIIDGTSDARVICSSSLSTTNYALSKIEFAKKSVVDVSKKSFGAFKEVFRIINEILSNS